MCSRFWLLTYAWPKNEFQVLNTRDGFAPACPARATDFFGRSGPMPLIRIKSPAASENATAFCSRFHEHNHILKAHSARAGIVQAGSTVSTCRSFKTTFCRRGCSWTTWISRPSPWPVPRKNPTRRTGTAITRVRFDLTAITRQFSRQ